MATSRPAPASVDEYIAAFAPNVQTILQRVRQAVRSAAPDAIEVISYRIPALKQNGHSRVLRSVQDPHWLLSSLYGLPRGSKRLIDSGGEKGKPAVVYPAS